MGSISEQTIRTKSKPIIQEMDSRWVLWTCGVSFALNPHLVVVNDIIPALKKSLLTVSSLVYS